MELAEQRGIHFYNTKPGSQAKANKKALMVLSASVAFRLCDPVWIRTKDLLLRRQLLYPAELRDLFFFSDRKVK